MILDRARALLVLLLLPGAAAPVWAQYRRSGQLGWSFDDITANSGLGRVHSSQWAQSYKLDLDGPLARPSFGVLHAGFAYSEGASLSQTVNTGIPHQKSVSFMARADLFSHRVQRFLRLSPSYTRSYLHQEGQTLSGGFSNTVVDDAWGLSAGLSLPYLPALNYSRQISTQRNPSDTAPLNQRTVSESKTADYVWGHAVMHAGQQTGRTQDLLGRTPERQTDYRQAWLEANYYQPKWAGRLQSFYFRTDASQTAANGVVGAKVASASLGLATLRFKTAGWDSSVNYGANGSRDFLGERHSLSQSASLNSTRPLHAGRLSNALSLTHSPDAPSVGASDLLGWNRPLWRRRAALSVTGSGGWSRSPLSSTASDGYSVRLELRPGQPRSVFAESAAAETKFLWGSGGSRVDRYSIGASERSNTRGETLRLDRTRSRDFVSGAVTISDQLSLEASGSVTPQLHAAGGYGLGLVQQQQSRSQNENLHGSLTYNPFHGALLFASVTYANMGYTTSATATYDLGKTSFQVSYEYRQLSTPATYSRVSISLTRYL